MCNAVIKVQFNFLKSDTEDMRKVIKGSTLIISHQERILNIADEVILIKQGKVEKRGSKEELLGQVTEKPLCCKLGVD